MISRADKSTIDCWMRLSGFGERGVQGDKIMPDTMDFKAVAEASRVTSLERLEELYDAPRPNAVRIEMPAY